MQKQLNHLFYKNRGNLGVVLLVPLILVSCFSYPLISEGSLGDELIDAVAWILFIFYAMLRFWATLYVGGRKGEVLQTQGPYSISRNPLYLGSLCLGLSITLFFKSFSAFGAILAVGLLYANGVIRAEEIHLEKKFGEEYRKYCRRTPRLLPAFSSYRSEIQISVNARDLKKEVGRFSLALLMPIAAQVIGYLKMSAAWPHWFTLP